MPVRMLQLLGALLAVALLVVAPSMASDDPAPTAKAAGGGSGCDTYPPESGWGNGWWGHDNDGGRSWNGWGDGDGYFDGDSSDQGCDGSSSRAAQASKAGKVARVMVAVDRLRGGRCQHLGRSGRLGRPKSCATTNWMRAKGTTSWRHDIPRRLPSGRYRLHRRAVDAAGNREQPHLLHLRIR